MKAMRIAMMMLAAMLGLCSCVYDEPYNPEGGEESGMVNLVLRVGINNSPSHGGTRAGGEYPDGYPYDFEPAATVYEGINSLRVIIVDADKRVEHNRLTYFEDRLPAIDEIYGEMEFGVKGGQTKRVYLIANEASISPAIDFSALPQGAYLPDAVAEGWKIYRPWGQKEASPYIDNEGTAKSYVPMSEYFDIYIDDAKGKDLEVQKTLFITRSLVKFSFQLKSASPLNESCRISEIEFTNVMQKGYLIPNATEYLPSKTSLTENFRRVITTFKTPGFEDNKVLPVTFTPANFGINGVNQKTGYSSVYAPELYYCETLNNNAGNKFSIRCQVKWDDDEDYTTEYIELPNLPSFPRNTHVKVMLTMADRSISGSVILMPYIGVWLNPSFGLDSDEDNN